MPYNSLEGLFEECKWQMEVWIIKNENQKEKNKDITLRYTKI